MDGFPVKKRRVMVSVFVDVFIATINLLLFWHCLCVNALNWRWCTSGFLSCSEPSPRGPVYPVPPHVQPGQEGHRWWREFRQGLSGLGSASLPLACFFHLLLLEFFWWTRSFSSFLSFLIFFFSFLSLLNLLIFFHVITIIFCSQCSFFFSSPATTLWHLTALFWLDQGHHCSWFNSFSQDSFYAWAREELAWLALFCQFCNH